MNTKTEPCLCPSPEPRAIRARRMRAARAAAAFLLASAGTACSGSSGGGTTQNLEVVGLEATASTAFLGHELYATAHVEAAHATTDVGIAFLAASAADVEARVPEPALQMVDTGSIAEVQAGDNSYLLTVDLPEDTLLPGTYYLLAVVDPMGATPETDEDDNSYTVEEIEQRGVRLTVSAAEHRPDLLLQSVAVDRILVEVDVSQDVHPPAPGIGEVPNGEMGVSATIRAAAWDALTNVKLGMYVRIPALGPQLWQMTVWDTAAQAYVAFVTVASLDPDEHSAVHVEGVLTPTLRMELARHVGEVLDADLLVYVDPTDDHPEFENGIISQLDEDGFDNGIFTTIALRISDVIPRVGGPVGQLDWEVPFDKSFSNGNVGVGLRFGASADVGSNGIHAEAMASVPVTLAGSTFDFCNLDAVGLYDPLHADDNGMVVTLKALNVKLYERRTKEDEALNPAPLTFQKEQAVSTTFMVGPVPMFVKLGARGTVGLELGASIGSAFALGAKPYLELDAFGEGGVGASYAGWTLGGGLAASLKLVDEKFHAGITATVSYDSVTSLMTGTIAEVVANELEGPSGQVALFVEASGEILWKTITERWEHVLVQWNPFVKSDTLFNQNQSLSVLID